jgi:hypothetical protein
LQQSSPWYALKVVMQKTRHCLAHIRTHDPFEQHLCNQ